MKTCATLQSPKRSPRRSSPSRLNPGADAAPLIYVVDDVPELAALYTVLLELAGCAVMAFTDRADALAALGADAAKPDLLITDYLNSSMPVDPFLENCRLFHPELRILMISGVGGRDASFARVRPDRFLAKPFAGDRFQKEVHAALLG